MTLPHDQRLLAATAPRWELSGATVKTESRDEIVKRIGRSPDFASALVMDKDSNAGGTEQQASDEPVRLPSRFWTAVDFGLMSQEAALEECQRKQAAGVTD